MKLVIGIRSRILLTAAISAFVLTTMASVVMVETFLRLILEESTKRLLVDSDAGACDEEPSNWTKSIPGISGEDLPEVHVYAVDESVDASYIAIQYLFPAGSWSDCLIPREQPPTYGTMSAMNARPMSCVVLAGTILVPLFSLSLVKITE